MKRCDVAALRSGNENRLSMKSSLMMLTTQRALDRGPDFTCAQPTPKRCVTQLLSDLASIITIQTPIPVVATQAIRSPVEHVVARPFWGLSNSTNQASATPSPTQSTALARDR